MPNQKKDLRSLILYNNTLRILLSIVVVSVSIILIYSRYMSSVEKLAYVELEGVDVTTELNEFEQIRKPYPHLIAKENLSWSDIDAQSLLVFNPNGNQILFQRESTKQRPIASITKLMTALVALDVYELTQEITVTKTIERMDLPLGLRVGDSIKVVDLLRAMLIGSKNDAGYVLANEYSGGFDAYILLMNQKAEELGMLDTHFSNPTGFSDFDNFSTAKDVMILANVALADENIRKIVDDKSANITFSRAGIKNSVSVYTTNDVLNRVGSAKGLKTGFTFRSGPSIVVYFDNKGEVDVVAILLNSSDRFGESVQINSKVLNQYLY